MTHTSRAQRGRQRRRHRQRVARVPRRRGARLRHRRHAVPRVPGRSTKGRSRRSRRRWSRPPTLARQAERLRLGDHLLLGRGEEKTGGRRKQALLADGYEALIAAIYLDGGIEQARGVHRPRVRPARSPGRRDRADGAPEDYKSALQEFLQSTNGRCPSTALAAARPRSPQAVRGRGARRARQLAGAATAAARRKRSRPRRARIAKLRRSASAVDDRAGPGDSASRSTSELLEGDEVSWSWTDE